MDNNLPKVTSHEALKFSLLKDSSLKFQQRRRPEWNETYSLYRDKVMTNRLTQRQSVNIPLMKSAIMSILKDIDDAPVLQFDNLDNNAQAQVFYNEYWREMAKRNKLKIKDIADKKQCLLFGRSFKKLNIVNGAFSFDIIDPMHMLVDRFVDPTNLDTARHIIQTDIFKAISDLEKNDDYDKYELGELKQYFESDAGILLASENFDELEDKSDRMLALGLEDAMDITVGETYVELNELYSFEYSKKFDEEVIFLSTFATVPGQDFLLQKKELCDILGKTKDDYWKDHYPLVTWAIDVDMSDFWSDGAGDILRTSNKIANSYFSQIVENRTLQNFGMRFYDATKNKDFIPQTFIPKPFGFYGVPGKPKDVMESVNVPALTDSLPELEFLLNLAKESVAATNAQQGNVEQRKVTLGEVEMAVANAKERVQSSAVFYNDAWLEFGTKYIKMLEGSSNLISPIEITRKGRISGTRNYTTVVSPEDWLSTNGYSVDAKLVTDKQEEDIQSLEKLNGAVAVMPNNAPLMDIYKKKVLEFSGLNPEEIQNVLEFERQAVTSIAPEGSMGGTNMQPNGENPVLNLPAGAMQPAQAMMQ